MQAMNRRQANALIRMGGTDTSALKNFGHMKKPNRTRTSDFQGPPKAWPAQARKQWADRLQQMSVVKQKDRIKFWNIVPGDYVRVKRGNVASQLGLDPNVHKVKPEGVVVRIDRMKNVAYLKVEADSPEKVSIAPGCCYQFLAPIYLPHVLALTSPLYFVFGTTGSRRSSPSPAQEDSRCCRPD